MERDEKVEKKDSSERNFGEGRRDDDVVDADAALLTQNEVTAFNDSVSRIDFNYGFGPPHMGLDPEAVSLALFNENYGSCNLLTSATAPPPENQELRRDTGNTSTDAAFKNLDQPTINEGSAAPPENQEDRRRNSGEGRRDDVAVADAALLPQNQVMNFGLGPPPLGLNLNHEAVSRAASSNRIYPRHLTSTTAPPPENQELRRDTANTSTDAALKNLGIGDTATTAPPTTTAVASNPPPPLQNQNTVSSLLKLQAALLDFGILQKHIRANDPFQLMTETALTLLQDRFCCMGGCSSFEVTAMGGWKEAFEQCCNEERGRVDKVTTECNARKNVQKPSAGRYAVVTIMVSVQGEHELPIINSLGDMETALIKLASIPSDSANDTKVMWSPKVNLGTLSDTELFESYPSIVLFDRRRRSFGVFGR